MGMYVGGYIFAIIIIVIVLYCYWPRPGDRIYMCPKCGMRFNKEPSLISIHFFDFLLITCPYCGQSSMMRRLRG
jgi:predicted RNA-binding Zn-ribbon protein involved in translation (DUF1610 family)